MPVLLVLGGTLFMYAALWSTAGMLTHEDVGLYLRPMQYLLEFRLGHFPPRLFPTELEGAGYPFPLFYPPLAPWLTAGFMALLGDVVTAAHISLLLLTAASGLSMYSAAVVCGAHRWLALACAMVYLAAPFRFIDVFVRGALAESATFIWYPLIIGSALAAVRKSRFSPVLALSIAGLLLTHTVMALYFALLSLPLAVAVLAGRSRRAIQALVAGVGVGGMLSLWHVLPAHRLMIHLGMHNPVEMKATLEQVVGHTLTSNQILWASREHWFGFSPTDMSFPIGLAPALAMAAAVLMSMKEHYRNRCWTPPALHATAALASVAACILFVLAPAPPLRVLPQAFSYIQFPWRVLGIAVFFAALAPALAASTLSVRAQQQTALVLLIAVMLVPKWQRTPRVNPEWRGSDVDAIQPTELGPPIALTHGEYLPAGTHWPETAAALAAAPQLLYGTGTLTMRRTRQGIALSGEVVKAGLVRLPLLAYLPLWSARTIGGRELPLGSNAGLLVLALEPGHATVVVERRTPQVMLIGRLLSLMAAALLLGTGAFRALAGRAGRRWRHGGLRREP